MKCPVCKAEVKKDQYGTVPVISAVGGELRSTYAHVDCLEEQRKARTTVQSTARE